VKRAAIDDAAGAHADGDHATAALDQQGATTPASDPTRPPGSGRSRVSARRRAQQPPASASTTPDKFLRKVRRSDGSKRLPFASPRNVSRVVPVGVLLTDLTVLAMND
jgi:hypothetical protein